MKEKRSGQKKPQKKETNNWEIKMAEKGQDQEKLLGELSWEEFEDDDEAYETIAAYQSPVQSMPLPPVLPFRPNSTPEHLFLLKHAQDRVALPSSEVKKRQKSAYSDVKGKGHMYPTEWSKVREENQRENIRVKRQSGSDDAAHMVLDSEVQIVEHLESSTASLKLALAIVPTLKAMLWDLQPPDLLQQSELAKGNMLKARFQLEE
ncbi:hypothetical protein IW262DRAFT_1460373 [Armillaria fumosa]|nr:hypothetical protein IW262DRAFT_1460373 [Armillaria fumosa]